MERTSSTLRVLQTPVTTAPKCFANCTAKVPTPPAAPLMRTVWPGWMRALSRSPWRAVAAATGSRGGLLEADVVRLDDERRCGCADKVGERATAGAEDRVARFELGHAAADRFHFTGDVHARVLGFVQAHDEAKEPGLAFHQLPVERIETDGANPDEDLAVTRSGLRGFLAVENVRGTKVAIDDGYSWHAPLIGARIVPDDGPCQC